MDQKSNDKMQQQGPALQSLTYMVAKSEDDRQSNTKMQARKNKSEKHSSGHGSILKKRTAVQARLTYSMDMSVQQSQPEASSLNEAGEEESVSGEVDANGETMFTCPFPGCEKKFSRKIRLSAHMHLHYGT